MRTLADDSVDVAISDPPFEDEAHTKQRRVKGGSITANEALPFAAITGDQRVCAAQEIARVTRRWALLFCQVEASQDWALAGVSSGLDYVRTMVWIKPDGMPQYTGDRPGMGYESIVVLHRPGRKRWNGGGRHGVFTECKNAGRPNGAPAPHPTTKPLPLMRELVSLFSDPDELVLDPFSGSGSTGVACRQLNRRFLGWELNRDYFDIACRRLRGDEAKPNPAQPSLFGGAA
jgi:site-specific DNA-methyltransferase (adenine-specific)